MKTQVSSRYARIDTTVLLSRVSSAVDLSSAKHYRGRTGTTHRVSIDIKGAPQLLIDGDYCKPTIEIINSYNGESPLFLGFGVFRLVCSNGLMLGQSVFSRRVRHIQGENIDTAIESFVSTILNLDLDAIHRHVSQLGEYRATRTDVERILDDVKAPKRAYNSALYAFENPRRQADVGDSAWQVYNRVQEALNATTRGVTNIQINSRLMNEFLNIPNYVSAPTVKYPKLKIV